MSIADSAAVIRSRLDVADRLRQRNELRAALTHYNSVLATVPDQPHALLGIALVALATGSLALGAMLSRQALVTQPDLAAAWAAIATAKSAAPRHDVIAAQRAVAIQPWSAPGLVVLGDALITLHDGDPTAEDALGIYEKALAELIHDDFSYSQEGAVPDNSVMELSWDGYDGADWGSRSRIA